MVVYITISELAGICGFTEATATNYYYIKLLPKPAYIEKKSRGRKVMWWLIDDVMAYSRSLIKPPSYKDVDLKKVRKLTNERVKRSEMAEILGIPEHTISDACMRAGIKSLINNGDVGRRAREKKVKKQNTFNQFLAAILTRAL